MGINTPVVPITLIQAVNMLLDAVGTAEVMTLESNDLDEETQKAVNTLSTVAVSVLSRGWHFNTDTNYPLTPDAVTGQIVLPPNANFMGLSERSSYRFATVRQGMLWDLKNHTYSWINGTNGTSTNPDPLNGPLYVNLTWLFKFDECPELIRWLITAKAGRQFGTGRVPDEDTYRFTDVVYQDALADALTWESDCSARFAEDNPHFFFMRARSGGYNSGSGL